jgi:hypothetical protein
LSGISSAMFNFETGPFAFTPSSGYVTYPGKLSITETYYEDTDEEIKNCNDPKIYLYTTSSSPNITYYLPRETGDIITIELDKFVDDNYDKYNTLIVVSRKMKKDDSSSYVGHNYI